jgi:XTP/dITP diphosphohydrolase
VVVASGNAHKVAELRAMLRDAVPDLEVVGMKDLGQPPEIEETAPDFVGNAKLKATGIAAWLYAQGEAGTTAVLADDSGVCVDRLDGAPGVRSARFAGEDATDADNNRRLVEALTALGVDRSPGHYVCVLALARVDGGRWPGETQAPVHFDGRWDVELRVAARGTGGFGYDPHAWLPGADQTVAELSADAKAAQSHRGAAFRALAAWLADG